MSMMRARWVLVALALLCLVAATAIWSEDDDSVLTCNYWGCGNEVPLHCISWEQDGITWTCWEAYKAGGPEPF